MKKYFFIFLISMSLISVSSCDIDDGVNFIFVPLQITNADLPESFRLNETFEIVVTYAVPDDCTIFSGFDVTDADLTVRNVAVFGSMRTDSDNCEEQFIERTATFDFNVVYDEPYVFRFWQGTNADGEPEFFEVEVPVE